MSLTESLTTFGRQTVVGGGGARGNSNGRGRGGRGGGMGLGGGNGGRGGGAIYVPTDSDAASYIALVEAADGELLESAVRQAIDEFVLCLKANSIWSVIDAACIMAAARTVNGALIPLKGTTPTNNGFVSADYNRETGLKGNTTSKYIDTNYPSNTRGLEDRHSCVWVTEVPTTGSQRTYYGSTLTGGSSATITFINSAGTGVGSNAASTTSFIVTSIASVLGYVGLNTTSTANRAEHRAGLNTALTTGTYSLGSGDRDFFVFADNFGSARQFIDARMSYYSFGQELPNRAAYESCISTFMTNLAAAI